VLFESVSHLVGVSGNFEGPKSVHPAARVLCQLAFGFGSAIKHMLSVELAGISIFGGWLAWGDAS